MKPESQEKRPRPSPFLKYTGMAFQMGLIIAGGVILGSWLDGQYVNETPWFTISIGLFSIFAALYLTLRDLIKGK